MPSLVGLATAPVVPQLAAAAALTPARVAVLVAAGIAAGIVNGVAGGGTLVTFPTLLALGYPAITANVTSTVGIWPGYLGGMSGFSSEIRSQRDLVRRLCIPAIVGALLG